MKELPEEKARILSKEKDQEIAGQASFMDRIATPYSNINSIPV